MIDHATAGPGPDTAPGPTGVSPAHCSGCGRTTSVCGGCGRQLDPPRFCPQCGRRLTVAVSPGGYRARCRDHGPVPAAVGA